MRIRLLLIVLLTANVCLGQQSGRMNIAGTRWSIVCPEGFVPAEKFNGIQGEESAIMIVEMPVSYHRMIESFPEQSLKARSMKLDSVESIGFNNEKATVLHILQSVEGINLRKLVLIFGNDTFTVMATGSLAENAEEGLQQKIRTALLSIAESDSGKKNGIATNYSVDVTGTDLKLAGEIGPSIIYSTNGKIEGGDLFLSVSNSIRPVFPKDKFKYAMENVKKGVYENRVEIKEMEEVSIGGLQGYEITAHIKTETAQRYLLYQVMLFEDSGYYYIINCIAKEANAINVETFKRVAKTFKLKSEKRGD